MEDSQISIPQMGDDSQKIAQAYLFEPKPNNPSMQPSINNMTDIE